MKDASIDKISIKMNFNFKDEKTTQKIYDALQLESDYDPNERAQTTISIKSATLIVRIDAADSVSARASANSFLKWINLSGQLLGYIEDKGDV